MRANRSFGATTLRDRHASVKGGRLTLCFRGKSGRMQRLTIENRRLARIVRKCQDLPGQRLFQYLDAEGERRVTSSDVNDYLRATSGADFTAKHFRTWGASVIAFAALAEGRGLEGIGIKAMLAPVAEASSAIRRRSAANPMSTRR